MFGFKRRKQERVALEEAEALVAFASYRLPRLYQVASAANGVGDSDDWEGWAEIEKHKRTLER